MKQEILIDNEFYINLGRALCLKSEEICFRALKDYRKLENLYINFYNKNIEFYRKIDFKEHIYYLSFRNGINNATISDYWLRFLMGHSNPEVYKDLPISDFIKKVAKQLIDKDSISDYSKFDFHNDKFVLTHGYDSSKIILIIPYIIDKLMIDLSIQIIEEFTTSKVIGISLLYYTHESPGRFFDEIEISLLKNEMHPYINREKFLTTTFNSIKEWYYDIPEFKEYVEKVNQEDGNTN